MEDRNGRVTFLLEHVGEHFLSESWESKIGYWGDLKGHHNGQKSIILYLRRIPYIQLQSTIRGIKIWEKYPRINFSRFRADVEMCEILYDDYAQQGDVQKFLRKYFQISRSQKCATIGVREKIYKQGSFNSSILFRWREKLRSHGSLP